MDIKAKDIEIRIPPDELIIKEAKPSGSGAIVYLPKSYVGKKLIIIEYDGE